MTSVTHETPEIRETEIVAAPTGPEVQSALPAGLQTTFTELVSIGLVGAAPTVLSAYGELAERELIEHLSDWRLARRHLSRRLGVEGRTAGLAVCDQEIALIVAARAPHGERSR